MSNNFICKKRCLECVHCDPICNISCRDCTKCKTFITDPIIKNHDIPRDMLYLSKLNEPVYTPIPLSYNKPKKKNILDPNNNLCYLCNRHDMLNDRFIFRGAKGRAMVGYSEQGGEIIKDWSGSVL